VLVEFFDIDLVTAPGRVFTPRPATEQLVERALAAIGGRAARVADVGTGAGAIAVALAVNAPRAEIWATDTSAEAVALAQTNAARHGVAHRVHVQHGSLLEPVHGLFDLVVANLPYLPEARRAQHEYEHEPADAVYARGDGLGHYRRLLGQARRRLRPGGTLLVQLHRKIVALGPD
jgi:release factor glutamine methyltransferase